MEEYMKRYNYWLESDAVDEATKSELRAIAGDETEIEGRFSAPMLSFGTAGLRGLMKAGTMCMNVYVIRYATQAVADLIIECGGQEGGSSTEGHGVAIAHDSRNNSRLYAEEVAGVLAANGIRAFIFDDLRPTPELSYAVRETGSIAGINVTASHNAKEYNGYKVYWADGAQVGVEHAEAIAERFKKIDIFKDVKHMSWEDAKAIGLVTILGEDTDERYMSCVLAQSVGRKYVDQVADDLEIVYSPFHGAGYRMVPEILRRAGIKRIIPVEEQMIPDGNFPTVKSPNPENPEGFALAIEYAKKHGSELVIGTDPDSDRCGAVVKNGDEYVVLSGNQMACLMLDYLITVRREQGTLPDNAFACRSIVSTTMADAICKKNDVTLFKVLTGFKFIGEKIKEYEDSGEYQFLFGFEEAIGFLAGTYCRDKDACVASLLMAEIGCYYKSKGMTVYEGLQSLYEKYGYFVEKTTSYWFEGYDAQDKMAAVMVKLRANPPESVGLPIVSVTDYLDDVPGFTKSNVLVYDLEGGNTMIVRPSGTEPRVKSYVLANGASAEEAEKNYTIIREAAAELLK